MKEHWLLEPDIVFLNHGSFGAAPIPVLERQSELRAQLEREPVRFMSRELQPLLDAAREELAAFVGAAADDIAFVPNATAGVNAVLRSLDLDKNEELLVTTHEYNASRNALEFVATQSGAKLIPVEVPFPITSPDVVVEKVTAAVTEKTRLLLIDHVTSQTGLIFPVERIVRDMSARGIDTLIDGAHAPGMLPLNLRELGAAYYTGNLHKWCCAPKGAGFLYVRQNRRYKIRPTAISHGANATRTDRSRFHLEFDWTGTFDPTAWLAVPTALRFIPSLVDGGWPEVRRRNHELVLKARDLLCARLDIPHPAPDAMLGSMAAMPIPDGDAAIGLFGDDDPLHGALLDRYKIEVPIMPWPAPPKRTLRVSAMLYNRLEEYERLADALLALL